MAFRDAVGLERADVLGYSMGATTGLQVAMRHPEKVDQVGAISVACDFGGTQPAFREFVPQMTVDTFAGTPMEDAWRDLAPRPDSFRAFVEKMIALEHEPNLRKLPKPRPMPVMKGGAA